MSTQAGRTCPLHYRYRPEALAAGATLRAETLYVVGGIYGNVDSLRRVLEMKREDERKTGGRVDLFFNGDFNWFDCDPAGFVEINETVLEHRALRGNVETELDGNAEDGCGCNYPDYVEAPVVERSNAIMQRLQACAADFADICAAVTALPMHASVDVGEHRIAILHGDPESLAGWGLAYESAPALAGEPEHAARHRGPLATVEDWLRRAEVSAFACTHTGLPFLQDFALEGERRLVINNGAAGMPNFKGTSFGVLSRISSRPEVPPDSLYATTLGAVRFDAVPIRYDTGSWSRRFLANWPAGSPAHEGYFDRLSRGPEHSVDHANRLAERSLTTRQARPAQPFIA